MEYLKRVLGIEVLYENKALEHLPNFISTRYDSQKVSLNGQKTVFLYPKTELEQVETLKKHLERVKKVADCPVILVLEQITARQKEYLLREKIAFIVDGKQIYLPFMAAYLQERCDAEKSDREEILPSAQMLLLYFIYEGAKELSTSQAAKDLDLTALAAWPLVRMVESPRAQAVSSAAKGSRQTSKARWRVSATGRPALAAASRAACSTAGPG